MYKTSKNLIIGRSHFYVHMLLLSVQLIFVHMREYLHLPILRPLKYVNRALSKGLSSTYFLYVMFHEVKTLMAHLNIAAV